MTETLVIRSGLNPARICQSPIIEHSLASHDMTVPFRFYVPSTHVCPSLASLPAKNGKMNVDSDILLIGSDRMGLRFLPKLFLIGNH
jgi:hypothetical protein